MAYFADIDFRERELKAVAEAATSEQGVTRGDLDRFKQDADTVILSRLAGRYSWTALKNARPPLLVMIANRLVAAAALTAHFQRQGLPLGEDASYYERSANDLLELLVDERMPLTRNDGTVILPTKGARVVVENVY